MSRNRIATATVMIASALGASALVLSAESVAATPHRVQARAAAAATIDLRHTKLGMLLVNSRGFTVYAFTRDRGRRDVCVSIKNCTKFWPPVRTSGAPRAGHGVKRSLLGTTRIRGGSQVTYAGHPLYTYIGDKHPGSTFYVNFFALGGRWPGLRASGAMVK